VADTASGTFTTTQQAAELIPGSQQTKRQIEPVSGLLRWVPPPPPKRFHATKVDAVDKADEERGEAHFLVL